MNTTPTVYRQGDIAIIYPASTPKPGALIPRIGGRIVLAHGKVTGHDHAIPSVDADLFELDGTPDRLLVARAPVQLVHDEHATIDLPAGAAIVRRQVEYTPEASRQVED